MHEVTLDHEETLASDQKPATDVAKEASTFLQLNLPRFTKIALGLVAFGVGGWTLARPLVLSASSLAVVGGTTTALYAPIEGRLETKQVAIGSLVAGGTELGTIKNSFADDRLVRDLENQLQQVEAELGAATPVVQEMESFASGLKQGTQLYQDRRVAQLTASLAQAQAQLELERASAIDASKREGRAHALSTDGLLSEEKISEAERDARVGEQRVEASSQVLESTRMQLVAAKQGVNIDTSGMGSDRPYSGQRLDQVKLDLMKSREQIAKQVHLRDLLTEQLRAARARFEELTNAAIVAPRRARVLSVGAASNAFVNRGQRVVSLLDCDSLLVVATVSERLFDRLRLGSPARFKLRGGQEELRGQVTLLIGKPGAPLVETLTAPGLLGVAPPLDSAKEEPRVVVAVPDLAKVDSIGCSVGKSGEVYFE